MKTLISILVLIILIGAGIWLWQWPKNNSIVTPASGDTVTVSLGKSGGVNGVTITPREVLEDSRCPTDVQCIQAGRVRLRATLAAGMGTADQTFIVGEPITTEAEAVTLLAVVPAKVSTKQIAPSEYRFTFKVVKQAYTYKNATADLITVDTPYPGSVTGKTFAVKGKARGTWYFEASFPVVILDKDGNRLAAVPAQAEGNWMTTEFVPFTANITVPNTYIGPATVVLKKDNPSGDPSRDASVSYPITIEY